MTMTITTPILWCASRRLVAALAVALAGCSSVGPPLPPPAQVEALANPMERVEYRIHVGDLVEIDFPFQPAERVKLPVRPDGRISIPDVGDIPAEGKTTTELAADIKPLVSQRLRDPEVIVVVHEFGERRVYVGGEVKRPGFVKVQDGMTPLQAVLAAGGAEDGAELREVLYAAPGRDGQFHSTRVDLDDVVTNGTPEIVRLVGDDIVYVPRSRIGNANDFIQEYVRNMMPIETRAGTSVPLSAGQ
jgi:protein involved in polysaccharide export with SLBB domain